MDRIKRDGVLLILFMCLVMVLSSCSQNNEISIVHLNKTNQKNIYGNLTSSGIALLDDMGAIFDLYEAKCQYLPDSNEVMGTLVITLREPYVGAEDLYLNLYANAYNKCGGKIDIISVGLGGKPAQYEIENTILKVLASDNRIVPGQVITVKFLLTIPTVQDRFGQDDNNVLLGNWLPTLAAYSNGKWVTHLAEDIGDPSCNTMAFYDVSFTMPSGFQIVSTGVAEEVSSENEKVVRIRTGPVRDFACVISDSTQCWMTTTPKGTSILLSSSLDIAADRVDAFLRGLVDAISYLESRVGPYPYDRVRISTHRLGNLSGMEFSNMFVLNTDLVENESLYRMLQIAFHELAHQWFYNVVGNDQVSEAWLDEALVEYLVDGFTWREFNHEQRSSALEKKWQRAQSVDMTAVFQDTGCFKNRTQYINTVYLKGALMLHTLEQTIGTRSLDTVLRQYYANFAFAEGNTSSFIAVAEEVTEMGLGSFFSTWLKCDKLPMPKHALWNDAINSSSSTEPNQGEEASDGLRQLSDYIYMCIKQEYPEMLFTQIKVDRLDELRERLLQDIGQELEGSQSTLLGYRTHINEEDSKIAVQVQTLYEQDKDLEIRLDSWEFDVEQIYDRWQIVNYKCYKNKCKIQTLS